MGTQEGSSQRIISIVLHMAEKHRSNAYADSDVSTAQRTGFLSHPGQEGQNEVSRTKGLSVESVNYRISMYFKVHV